MLREIVAISGKPGLFKVLSQGKNMFIVESLIDKKRFPAYARDRVVSLGEIAMFTEDGEKPLNEVLEIIKTKENAAQASTRPNASNEELSAFMESILPNYDKDRVHYSDIKKLISWYNLLIESKNDDFSDNRKQENEAE